MPGMQINLQQDQCTSSPIIMVRPLSYSCLKIIIILLLIISVDLILIWYSYRYAILVSLILILFIAYFKNINHKIIINIFYQIHSLDNQTTTKYLINDLSYTGDENNVNTRKSNNWFIVNIHFRQGQIKYFHFKEELYMIQQGVVSTVKWLDIIKKIQIQGFNEYLIKGILQYQLQISKKLFGYQKKYINPSIWDFVVKRLQYEKQWILVNMFLILVSFFVAQQTITGIILAILNLIIFGLILYDQSKKVKIFSEKFKYLIQKQFSVHRKGEKLRVNYSEILVGDIIQIQKSEGEEEYMTYFKSLLVGQKEVICKQGPNRQQSIKNPVTNFSELREDRKARLLLEEVSFIEKASLIGNQRLIVLENNSISKFFSLWFEKGTYAEFKSIFQEDIFKVIKLYFISILLLFLASLIVHYIINHDLQLYNKQVFASIILISFILPSVMHFLYCLSHNKCLRELQKRQIQVLSFNLAFGNISNIVINSSELIQLQFQEILYKNLIFDASNRPFEPDSATLENGRTYESLLSVIFYISLGYFDKILNNHTFLQQIYEKYEEYFDFQDTLFDYKNIVHKSTGKIWRLVHFDSQDKQARSWRIQYENHLKYMITECSIQNQNILDKYIGSQDQNRLQYFKDLANSLVEEGKKLKLILFKSFKKDHVNIRGTELYEILEQEFRTTQRQKLQKDMQFAAFVIFDNALNSENSKVLQYLRDLGNQSCKTFNLSIYSNNTKQNLSGFEHILENIPISYQYRTHQKTSLVRSKMLKKGTLLFCKDVDDHYGQLISDVSIKVKDSLDTKNKIKKIFTPSDVYLKKMSDITKFLQAGDFTVKFRYEAARYSFIVWFWIMFGYMWTAVLGQQKSISYFFIWPLILIILLIVLPLVIKNQLFWTNQLNFYGKLTVYTIKFAFQLLLSILISLTILIVAYYLNICEISANTQTNHMIIFRTHTQQMTGESCINLPVLLGGSASILSFVIYYDENFSSSNNFEKWRFVMVGLWGIMLVVSKIPLPLILLSIGLLLFITILKIIIKQLRHQQNFLKQSSSILTNAQ